MVCLSSGRFSITAFSVAAKPRSRILSASSKTKKQKWKWASCAQQSSKPAHWYECLRNSPLSLTKWFIRSCISTMSHRSFWMGTFKMWFGTDPTCNTNSNVLEKFFITILYFIQLQVLRGSYRSILANEYVISWFYFLWHVDLGNYSL